MDAYIKDDWQTRGQWIQADTTARAIDKLSCASTSEINWTIVNPSWDHPRRYGALSEFSTTCIREFTTSLRKELEKVKPEDVDKPVPRATCYIGWSRKAEGRRLDHYKHHRNGPALPDTRSGTDFRLQSCGGMLLAATSWGGVPIEAHCSRQRNHRDPCGPRRTRPQCALHVLFKVGGGLMERLVRERKKPRIVKPKQIHGTTLSRLYKNKAFATIM